MSAKQAVKYLTHFLPYSPLTVSITPTFLLNPHSAVTPPQSQPPLTTLSPSNQMDKATLEVDTLTVRELQHELRKRGLSVTGIKRDLRKRVIKALRSEYAEGWTLGYLLEIKIIPFNGRGRDPRTLIGRHVTGLGEIEDNKMVIMLSDGEDPTIVCQASDADDLEFHMDEELFRLFHTSSGESRTYVKNPLLVTDATIALCKNIQGVAAATIFGIKLAGMKEMAFINVLDKEELDDISWAELVDAWLGEDGEAGLKNSSSMIMHEGVRNNNANPLLAGNDRPIKTEKSLDDIGNGWVCQQQAGEAYPPRSVYTAAEEEDKFDEWKH